MATFNFTPVQHQVFNHYDRFGLLLGLPRLESERNPEYKERLMDVFVHRSNSTYLGLINGITRELGLELYQPLKISRNSPGHPVIRFLDTKVYVYSDYTLGDAGLVATFDRFEYKDNAYTIGQLVTKIQSTGLFLINVDSDYLNKRSMTIFNQSNLSLIPNENISRAGGAIKLANSNLIPNSITVRSANLTERVASQTLLRKRGQYYIEPVAGIIFTTEAPAPGSAIRYQYINDNYTVTASPVIIHDLQSDDFKTKMFEQILTEDGTYTNGLPTELGADLINELLSVFPTAYGA